MSKRYVEFSLEKINSLLEDCRRENSIFGEINFYPLDLSRPLDDTMFHSIKVFREKPYTFYLRGYGVFDVANMGRHRSLCDKIREFIYGDCPLTYSHFDVQDWVVEKGGVIFKTGAVDFLGIKTYITWNHSSLTKQEFDLLVPINARIQYVGE